MVRNVLLVLLALSCFLRIFVDCSWAGVFVSNADTSWEVRLEHVTISISPAVTSELFISNADASWEVPLEKADILILPAAASELFISNADAILGVHLEPVVISPLSASISELFVSNADAILAADLVAMSSFAPVRISVEPDVLDFGDVRVGSSFTKHLCISNAGTASLEISSIACNSRDFTPDIRTCTIPPGNTVAIGVTCTPSSLGDLSAQVIILSSDMANPTIRIELTGRAYQTFDTGFTVGRDNYGFTNSAAFRDQIFYPLVEILSDPDSGLPEAVIAIAKIMARMFSLNGNCAGMSETSAMYFVNPFLKPVSPDTPTHDLSPEQALEKIVYYQRNAAGPSLVAIIKSLLDFGINYASDWDHMSTVFPQGHPVVLALTLSGYNEGHAVVAYKLVDYGDRKRIFIYDVNHLDDPNTFLELTDMGGEYVFSGYRDGDALYNRFHPFDPWENVDPIELADLIYKWFRDSMKNLVDQGKALFRFYRLRSQGKAVGCNTEPMSLAMHDDVWLVDEFNRIVGVKEGKTVNQIPGSAIIDSIAWTLEVPSDLNYTMHLVSRERGQISIDGVVPNVTDQHVRNFSFEQIAIPIGSEATLQFSLSGVSDLEIDHDADGQIDQTLPTTHDVTMYLVVPSPPTDLSAIAISDHQIHLSWMDRSADELGFVIERKKGSDTTYAVVGFVGSDVMVYADSALIAHTTYSYRVAAQNAGGNSDYSNVASATTYEAITPVDQDAGDELPQRFALYQNHPNPFNASTVIRYALPHPGTVDLSIYTLQGQRIRTLVEEQQQAGTYAVTWDGTDERGMSVASGIYFYRLEAAEVAQVKRMALIR